MDSYQPGTGEHYRVDTPERVDLDYDVASLGSRLLAALVDTLLLTVLYLLLLFLGGFALGAAATFIGDVLEALGLADNLVFLGSAAIALILLFSFGVFWGYYIFFEMIWHGQTPGKRWVGLRVIRQGGYPIGFAESAIRNLVRIVDFLPIYYGLGALVMFVDRQSRRLGDLAAGTLVVKERRDLRLESLSLPTAATGPDGLEPVSGEPIPNLHLLTPADQSLLREFLIRRPSLSEAAASSLALHLAEALSHKLGHQIAGESPEAFLVRLSGQLGRPT